MFCIPAGYFFTILIILIGVFIVTKSKVAIAIGAGWTLYYMAEFFISCYNYDNKPYNPFTNTQYFNLGNY
jgi:hypothetical protein